MEERHRSAGVAEEAEGGGAQAELAGVECGLAGSGCGGARTGARVRGARSRAGRSGAGGGGSKPARGGRARGHGGVCAGHDHGRADGEELDIGGTGEVDGVHRCGRRAYARTDARTWPGASKAAEVKAVARTANSRGGDDAGVDPLLLLVLVLWGRRPRGRTSRSEALRSWARERSRCERTGVEGGEGGADLLLLRGLVVRMMSIWRSWINRVNRSHAFPDLGRGKRQRSGVQARPDEDANAATEPRRRQP